MANIKIFSILFTFVIICGINPIVFGQFGPIDPDFLNWFWEVALDYNNELLKVDFSQLPVKDGSLNLNQSLSSPPKLHGMIDLYDGFVVNMGLVGVENRTVTCWTEDNILTFSGDITIQNTYMQYQYDAATQELGHLTGSVSPMMPQVAFKFAGDYDLKEKKLSYGLSSSSMSAPYNMKYFPENNNTLELSRLTKYQFTGFVSNDFSYWVNTTLNDSFRASVSKKPFRQCNA